MTKRVDFTQVGSTVLLEYKLLTNLPAKANAEFVIRAKSRGTMSEPSVDIEARVITDVVAKVQAPNIIPIIVPDDIPLSKTTPYTVEGSRGLLVVARATDAVNGYINTFVPVRALDNTGQVLGSFSSDNAISFRASVSNGSAKFVNGIALVPTKIKLNNGGNSTSIGHVFMSSSSSSGSSSRVQAVPDSNADCGDAPVGTVPVALDAPKTVFDTIANLPLVGGLLDWVNTNKSFEFDIAGIRFTAGDFVTLGWGVIPLVGDATVLADNFYNYLIGKGADAVEATLAGASLAFDATGNVAAGTAGSAMLFIFKVSKAGKGIFRDWMADVIRACTAKPSACYKLLTDEFTYLVELIARGGTAAIRNAEEQIARITLNLSGGLADIRQALGRLTKFPTLDALGNSITAERLLDVMDDVDNIPGFDRVANRIATAGTSGNIKGAFGELEQARNLRRQGATDLDFKGEATFADANGVLVRSDVDISFRDPLGNLIYTDVKSGSSISSIYFDPLSRDGAANLRQAQNFAEAARRNGAIPRWDVPDCSFVSSAALVVLSVTGIEVFDANLGKC